MSTNYYRLRKPFTSARTRPGGGHVGLSLWINHAKTGEIVVRNEELKDTLLALISDEPAVTQHGIGGGETDLSYNDDTMEVGTCLISEYGELTSLGEIGGADA